MPLFSLLLRKNRTAAPKDVAGVDRRFPLRARAGETSDVFFESGVATVIAASSLFISFSQKLALLQEIAVTLSDHLLL